MSSIQSSNAAEIIQKRLFGHSLQVARDAGSQMLSWFQERIGLFVPPFFSFVSAYCLSHVGHSIALSAELNN